MKIKHPCEFYIQGYEEMKKKYDNIINKIHAKIESLSQMDTDGFYKRSEWWKQDIIKILESLLENEK